MKKILDCFEYLKRYQIDLFESLCIILETLILKRNNQIPYLLQKAQKRKKIYQDYCQAVQQWVTPTPPNPHLNLPKVLKSIEETSFEDLGLFFDLITQKKTNNKLFFYTTPLEISILLNALADPQKGENLYNPCFGLGSLFLQIPDGVKIYGEELDERFVKIASRICILGKREYQLVCNDILKDSSFRDEKGFLQFDRIICNPPLHSHLGTNYIKEDERFSGLVSKNYPELIFFFHSLVHLKTRGVFVLRKGVFKNLESKLKDALLGRLECVIDLPKNIFPYQNYDFCIIIIGKEAEKILHIDASDEYFSSKDGRYNRIKNIDEIINLYRSFSQSRFSKILHSIDDLYAPTLQSKDGLKLSEISSIFKGQRVYGSPKDEKIEFFEIGASDFAPLGFSHHFSHLRLKGQKKKILQYALKPYDILISWRGNSPKITLLAPSLASLCVANMGVIVVRARDFKIALAIYSYLFSALGYQKLCEICTDCLETKKLKEFHLPSNFRDFASYIPEIEALALEEENLRKKITDLKERM